MIISGVKYFNYSSFVDKLFNIQSYYLKTIIINYIQTLPILDSSSKNKTLGYFDFYFNKDLSNVSENSLNDLHSKLKKYFYIDDIDNINDSLKVYKIRSTNFKEYMYIFLYKIAGWNIKGFFKTDNVVNFFDNMFENINNDSYLKPSLYLPELESFSYFKKLNDSYPNMFLDHKSESLPSVLNYGQGNYIIVSEADGQLIRYTQHLNDFTSLLETNELVSISLHKITDYYNFKKYLKLLKIDIYSFMDVGEKYFLFTK